MRLANVRVVEIASQRPATNRHFVNHNLEHNVKINFGIRLHPIRKIILQEFQKQVNYGHQISQDTLLRVTELLKELLTMNLMNLCIIFNSKGNKMKKPIITAEMLNKAVIALAKIFSEHNETAQQPQEDLSPKYRELEQGWYTDTVGMPISNRITKWNCDSILKLIERGTFVATKIEALQKDKLQILTTKYKAYVAEYNGVPMGESRWKDGSCCWYAYIDNDNELGMFTDTKWANMDLEFYVKDNEFKDFILKRMTIEEMRIVTTQDWRAIEV